MTPNRKMLFLGIAMVGVLFFFGGGFMIVRQSGLARLEKQNFYAKKARQKGDILVRRLTELLDKAGMYTNTSKLAEVFTAKSLNLNEFPDNFRSGIKRIRITDASGAVLLSTMGSPDNGNMLSSQVLALVEGVIGRFVVFTPNRDTFAALAKYEDPYNLQQKGYILFEFNTTAIFQDGLGEIEPVVRVENGVPLLVLKDNPQSTYQQIAAFDIFRSQEKNAPLTGLILSVPYMGNVVYYMGDNFYFPFWLSLLVVLSCFLMVGGLYFYLREQGGGHAYAPNNAQEVHTLISDIKKGKSYPKAKSFSALDKTSKFGSLPENDLGEDSYFDDDTPLPSFDDEPEVVKEVSVASVPERKSFVFESLEDSPSLEELHEEKEFMLPSDEDEFPYEGLQREAVDEAFDEINAMETDPNEESNNSLALLMDLPIEASESNLSIEDGAELGKKTALESYEEHLDEAQQRFGITRRAHARNNEGLFLIEDENIFGQFFQITVEDPIFQEILSEGKVISLSGSLEESNYIAGLVDHNILATLSDLFIVPILDEAKSVSDIIVLGRDKSQTALSVGEKQMLFSY